LTTIVETQSLTKRYPSVTALVDCTLGIQAGTVFGLLGPNGAGKTTLIRLLLGFLKPTSGSASILGRDCHKNRVAIHEQLCYLPGDARLFRTMRGRQVLKFFASVRKTASLKRALAVADRLELDLSRWVGFMSTGMRQKLALAACFSAETSLMILDEPTANLDPNVRSEILAMVDETRQQGRTVIFSSHVLSEVEEVCDDVAILRQGRLVHKQSMHSLKRQHRIRAHATGPLSELPLALLDQLRIHDVEAGEIMIETPGEISSLLKWLSLQPLQDVRVEPIGLRAIYDQYHSDLAATEVE